jgi:predicted metal-dependent hydrolase
MTTHSLPGLPNIALILRKSRQARRISLRVSSLDGRVTLTMPPHATEAEALDFAATKADWVRDNLANRPSAIFVVPGGEITVEGARRTIATTDKRRPILTPDSLLLPQRGNLGRMAQTFLRDLARDRLSAASAQFAQDLGRDFSRITLRDTRSRWGSCSSNGALMYQWRLIFAPPEVLTYVAAHEVAHLQEMNHSPAFWALVQRLYGPWKAQRDWLHDHGATLHRYRFDTPSEHLTNDIQKSN